MDGSFCSTSVRLTLVLRSSLPYSNTWLSSDEQTAAAIFSLINDYRLSQGFEPLGFLNPWLYGVGAIAFNDITEGNNPGARTQGFFAGEGWDPVCPARPLSSFSTSLIPSLIGHRPRDARL